MKVQNADPSKRVAQHTLAYEFVELVHGAPEAEAVSLQHRQLFRPRSSTAEPTPLTPTSKPPGADWKSPFREFHNQQSGNKFAPQTNFQNMPSLQLVLPRSLVINQHFSKILWSAGLVASRSEGHRIIANNGAYVGSRPGDSGPMSDALDFTPIKPWAPHKTEEFILDNCLLFLKIGKWKFKIVKIVSDEEFEKSGLSVPGWNPEEKQK